VAVGDRTSLNFLFFSLLELLKSNGVSADCMPKYRDFRAGDVRHSLADITRASTFLGYQPSHTLTQGLALAVGWYAINR
jgi:UDP-N-acetylglucosamine 4-epimerase